MDLLSDRDGMLSHAGSFFTGLHTPADRATMKMLTGISSKTNLFTQMRESINASLNGSILAHNYRTIRFGPDDVRVNITDFAMQRRAKDNSPSIEFKNESQLTVDSSIYNNAEEAEIVVKDGDLLFPIPENDIVLDRNVAPKFILSIDADILVLGITQTDGSLMLNGIDFESTYGKVTFNDHPCKLFPNLKFIATTSLERRRNLFNFPLQLNDVYGPVDRVLHYYKVSQSPKAFYYATAQAAGLPVMSSEATITNKTELEVGCIYHTSVGDYSAMFHHTQFDVGTVLPKDTVIGSDELFTMVCYGDTIPDTVSYLGLDSALPVKGLMAPNEEIVICADGEFKPKFTGDSAALTKYHAYLDKVSDTTEHDDLSMNGMNYILNVAFPHKWIIIRKNETLMSTDMSIKIDTFIKREQPLGSVLLYSPLTATITE